jgi:protein-L-isoaspartate(D-aspartate) O-methyltransferase
MLLQRCASAVSRRTRLPLLLLPIVLAAATTQQRSFARATRSVTSQPAPFSPDSLPASSSQLYQPTEMAWRCSGLTNQQLVDSLARSKIIHTRRVYDAMLAVDRGLFMPSKSVPAAVAYQDSPQALGFGATISAPHMHAMCLELLSNQLEPGNRALDVGSGSGYLVATMAVMMGAKQQATSSAATSSTSAAAAAASTEMKQASPTNASISVYGIEHIQELVDMSHTNLRRWDPDFASFIHVFKGDGRQGVKGEQFDAIHVGAAAPTIPEPLLQQLKPGGRLVIPVGTTNQNLICIDRDAHGKFTQQIVSGVRYVPLTDEAKQLQSADR